MLVLRNVTGYKRSNKTKDKRFRKELNIYNVNVKITNYRIE